MALDVYGSLLEAGHHLWIDAGCRSADDAALDTLRNTDNADIVVGLESVQSPVDLQRIVERVGPNRAVFSLDLMAGQPLGNVSAWPRSNAWTIAEHAIGQLSVRRLIVLDLANVGVGNGVGTEDLCVRLKHTHPQIEITTGGGVRGIEDVRRLTEIGVNYVLVASALHDGRITRDDIQSLAR
jgi:phosphoribosylformimino-5-aminoimidazole carboxamide ribotide isomerase